MACNLLKHLCSSSLLCAAYLPALCFLMQGCCRGRSFWLLSICMSLPAVVVAVVILQFSCSALHQALPVAAAPDSVGWSHSVSPCCVRTCCLVASLFIWRCRPAMASMYSGVMEGSGEDVAAWLTSPAFEARLFTCFPCTNITPSSANQVPLASPALSCPALPCPALPCPALPCPALP